MTVGVESFPFCFGVPRPDLRPKMNSAEFDVFGIVGILGLMPDKAKPSLPWGEDIMAITVIYKDTKGSKVENVMVVFVCFVDLEGENYGIYFSNKFNISSVLLLQRIKIM